MPITILHHLEDRSNRCLLIVLADSPLDEKNCYEALLHYGSIKKIELTSNRRAAFVDFECEHTPLLVARCFGHRKANPDYPIPKGAVTLLPGCSMNDCLFLQYLPRSLSSLSLQKFFTGWSGNEVIVHRTGTIDSPSSRAVIELNGVPAKSFTQHRKHIQRATVVSNGKERVFYAIPPIKQLIETKSIFLDNIGCSECSVSSIIPEDELEEMRRNRETKEVQSSEVDERPKCDDDVYSIVEVSSYSRAVSPAQELLKRFEELQNTDVEIQEEIAPFSPHSQFFPSFPGNEEEWNDVSDLSSATHSLTRIEQKIDYRNEVEDWSLTPTARFHVTNLVDQDEALDSPSREMEYHRWLNRRDPKTRGYQRRMWVDSEDEEEEEREWRQRATIEWIEAERSQNLFGKEIELKQRAGLSLSFSCPDLSCLDDGSCEEGKEDMEGEHRELDSLSSPTSPWSRKNGEEREMEGDDDEEEMEENEEEKQYRGFGSSLEVRKSSSEDQKLSESDEDIELESDHTISVVAKSRKEEEIDSDDLLSGEEDHWTSVGSRPFCRLSSVSSVESLPDTVEEEDDTYGVMACSSEDDEERTQVVQRVSPASSTSSISKKSYDEEEMTVRADGEEEIEGDQRVFTPCLEVEESSMEGQPVKEREEIGLDSNHISSIRSLIEEEETEERDSDDLLSGEEDHWTSVGSRPTSRLSLALTAESAVEDEKEEKAYGRLYDFAAGDCPSFMMMEEEDEDIVRDIIDRMVDTVMVCEDSTSCSEISEGSDDKTINYDTVSDSNTVSDASSDTVFGEGGGYGRLAVNPDEWDDEDLIMHGYKRLSTIDEDSQEDDVTSSVFSTQEVFMSVEDDERESVDEGVDQTEERQGKEGETIPSTHPIPLSWSRRSEVDSDDEEKEKEEVEEEDGEQRATLAASEPAVDFDVSTRVEEEMEEDRGATLVASDSTTGFDVRTSEELGEKMEMEPRVVDGAPSLISTGLCSRKSEMDSDDELVEENKEEVEEVPDEEQIVLLNVVDSVADSNVISSEKEGEKMEEKPAATLVSTASQWIRRKEMDSDDEEEEKEIENGRKKEEEKVSEGEQRASIPHCEFDVRTSVEVDEKMEGKPGDDAPSLISRKNEIVKYEEKEERMDEERVRKEEEEKVPEGERRVSVGSYPSIASLEVRTNERVEEKVEEEQRASVDLPSPIANLDARTSVEMEEKMEEEQRDPSLSSIAHLWKRRAEVDSDDESEKEMEGDEEEKKGMEKEAKVEEGEKGMEKGEGKDEEGEQRVSIGSSTLIASLDDRTNEKVEEMELEQRGISPKSPRLWSRSSVVDQEEKEDYRSIENEYHNWLAREDPMTSGDSPDGESDTDTTVVPLPSSLPIPSWGTGIAMEKEEAVDTVLPEERDITVRSEGMLNSSFEVD